MKENLSNYLMKLVHDEALPCRLAERIAEEAGVTLDTSTLQINNAILAIMEVCDLLNHKHLLNKCEVSMFDDLVKLIETKLYMEVKP